LLLVADENQQIAGEPHIRKQQTNPPSHPLYSDGQLLYSYFIPDSDCIVEISKKDASQETNEGIVLHIRTGNLQIGYIYKVVVTESGIQSLNFDPVFTENDPIVF